MGDKGNEVPVVPPEMTNGKIRETLLTLAGATITRVNKGIEYHVGDF